MEDLVVRRGRPGDAEHFARLALFTAPVFLPYYWGSDVRNILRKLFQTPGNWYSFEHTYVVEVDGEVAGMALGYSYRQKEEEAERTGEMAVECMEGSEYTELPDPRVAGIMEQVDEGDYYFQHLAVYPKFRSHGVGTRLMQMLGEEVQKTECTRVVGDVETDNTEAIKLYERLGAQIIARSAVVETGVKNFEFLKMGAEIPRTGSVFTEEAR
jgi:ribosomal protein S18 acetylase RimI-like enzyme